MRCEVLLFARLAEAVGRERMPVELPDGATVAEAIALLAAAYAEVGAMLDTLAVAVNERYASPDTTLHDGDTLALIPPVSGG